MNFDAILMKDHQLASIHEGLCNVTIPYLLGIQIDNDTMYLRIDWMQNDIFIVINHNLL